MKNGVKPMVINIDDVLEKAIEQAFVRALEQAMQSRMEDLFGRMLAADSPWGKKLEEKMQENLQRFMEEGVRWEKKRPGFRKG